ncbi:MAG: tetratricopeptide repeat protein [Bacteroidetes bacterium]|nr:tetratricopeptide repeat protein [Bacteroidota bacterium]
MLRYKLFFVCFLYTTFLLSQTNQKEKLAIQYFENKEFDKANAYFDDLFDKAPNLWFAYYYKSLISVKDFSKAEKITKKQLKSNKTDTRYYVFLGRIYKFQNEEKKEAECYDKAIKELLPVQPYIQNLANVFIEDQLFDRAIETYIKAKKTNPNYPYFYEIADVYKRKGDIKAMINEYLNALEFRESELYTVQANLQNNLGYDDDNAGLKNPILKQELLKRIQKSPDKIVLSEFLIFIQKQQNDFEGAFTQSKALDKRLKEDGRRIYDLAKICVSNANWDIATRCFNYIVDKGANYPFYDIAIIDGINAEFYALTKKTGQNLKDLQALELKYNKAIEKYAETTLSLALIKNLTLLQAYYLNKSDIAITLLQKAINSAGLEPITKAEFKLQLAGIYTLKNEIWDASLLYSQVEKDFKYEAIGQDAKFKNAKLSFYAGDFKWAKAQADILKGAASKLISNDAMELSLTISDAIGVDTNAVPLMRFAKADLLFLQHKYNDAILQLDSINILFATHTLADDIYFKKAQIYYEMGDYMKVEDMYKNILQYFPDDLYGDDAQYKLAQLYQQTGQIEKAKQAYQDVLTKYPGSIYSVEARKNYRALRGDSVTQ